MVLKDWEVLKSKFLNEETRIHKILDKYREYLLSKMNIEKMEHILLDVLENQLAENVERLLLIKALAEALEEAALVGRFYLGGKVIEIPEEDRRELKALAEVYRALYNSNESYVAKTYATLKAIQEYGMNRHYSSKGLLMPLLLSLGIIFFLGR